MRIGIVVHSHTGNTLSVAQKIKEELSAAGHTVALEQVTAVNEDPSAAGNIQLKTAPEVDSYDELIFGAPVRGLSLSPVMKAYLSQLRSLSGKKVACFVTQHFPYPWMGGTRSVRQIKEICEAKGANVSQTGIVNWSHKERERKIEEVVKNLGKI